MSHASDVITAKPQMFSGAVGPTCVLERAARGSEEQQTELISYEFEFLSCSNESENQGD